MRKLLSLVVVSGLMATTSFAATYKFDPAHTNARFEIDHFGTSTNHGGFYNLEGQLEYDAKKSKGKLEISLPLANLNTGNADFDGHMKSIDLLNAQKFPAITFKSTKWEFKDGKPAKVTGDLTILGKTNPVTLVAQKFNCYESPMFEGAEVCGGDFTASIDRTQWGVNYLVDLGFTKQVDLKIQVEAVKQ